MSLLFLTSLLHLLHPLLHFLNFSYSLIFFLLLSVYNVFSLILLLPSFNFSLSYFVVVVVVAHCSLFLSYLPLSWRIPHSGGSVCESLKRVKHYCDHNLVRFYPSVCFVSFSNCFPLGFYFLSLSPPNHFPLPHPESTGLRIRERDVMMSL